MKKKVWIIVLFFLSIIATVWITHGIDSYFNVLCIFNSNLHNSEKIKFLLNSIDNRLKNNDEKLVHDLSNFNKEYKATYEGDDFYNLCKKYMEKDYEKYNFIYK